MPPKNAPLSTPQRRVLSDALRLVRDQKARAEAEGAPFPPTVAWTSPFALGYFVGVVDGLCQAHGIRFDGMGLAIMGLVLDDTFGRAESDRLRTQAVALLDARNPDFARGRPWGGNEAIGMARGITTPVGLVHLMRGDEDRMGGPIGGPPA